MQVKGFLIFAGKYTTGNNDKGPWSVQTIGLKDYGKETKVKVWNRPDFVSAKGKFVEIDDVQNGKGKNEAGDTIDILELKSKDAKIEVKDKPSSSAPTGAKGGSGFRGETPLSLTLDTYLGVLDKVIDHVHRAFGKHQNVAAEAVAAVVNGTMVAFQKGHFVTNVGAQPVPAAQQQKPEEIDPNNIPL